DGGITSGLQEDHLCHATPAALKALDIIENTTRVLAIELLAAAQAYDLQADGASRAAPTDALWRHVRERVPVYRDDRPLADDIAIAAGIVASVPPPVM
ncbi:aromatic amino acid lyase, partial [Burkholderia pyrrocinia]